MCLSPEAGWQGDYEFQRSRIVLSFPPGAHRHVLAAFCILACSALALCGCKRKSVPAPHAVTSAAANTSAAVGSAAPVVLPYTIASSARVGCRSPLEAGCGSCCRPLDPPDYLRCGPSKPGALTRYRCAVDHLKCRTNEPLCARCSQRNEQDVMRLAAQVKSSDGPVTAFRQSDLDGCGSKNTPWCVRLSWAEASTKCQPELIGTNRNQATEAATAQAEPLPYTIASHSLLGCRDLDAPGCEYCLRTFDEDTHGVESRNSRFVSPELAAQHANMPACAQCMIDDEMRLRESAGRIQDCDCSTLLQGDGLIDSCFNPAGCTCACSEWVRASLRCPPALVLRLN